MDMTPHFFQKGGMTRITRPLNVWWLNANSSKIAKATDFRFCVQVLRDNTDVDPKIFFQKGAVASITWLTKFF